MDPPRLPCQAGLTADSTENVACWSCHSKVTNCGNANCRAAFKVGGELIVDADRKLSQMFY